MSADRLNISDSFDESQDFRDAAASASQAIVAMHRGRRPEDLDQSLCLPIEGAGPNSLRGLKWSILWRAIIGIGGVATGGILAAWHKYGLLPVNVKEGLLASIAAGCSISGIIVLLTSAFAQARFVRRWIGERYDGLRAIASPYKACHVAVEDAATFRTMKLVSEDHALVGFDAARRMLLVEGIRYRYLIHARDVAYVRQAQGVKSTGVEIGYHIASVLLRITLQYTSVRQELRKQTIGAAVDPLLHPVIETIGLGAVE